MKVGDTLLENVEHVSWHKTNIRWLSLALACAMQMGNYYCYDFPAVLQQEIQDQFHASTFQYNLLYTVYSLPNIVLPLFGGILIDFIGIRKGVVLFSIPLIIGQGIFSAYDQAMCILGSWTNQYVWLIIGRVMYGLGGENMSVVQSAIVSKWFVGKELAFALGLNITLSRLGSVMNSQITPKLYHIEENISISLIAGWFFLIFSWIACIALAVLDKNSDNRDRNSQTVEIEKISMKDCKEFKVDLAMVVVSCMICYTNLFVFQQNNEVMFKTLYHLDSDQANWMYQIPYYMGAALTPFIGIFIDRVGQRPVLLIVSTIILSAVDVWYMLMPACDSTCFLTVATGQIVLGIFYSFYASVLWPTVPLCVPEKAVGTAFGVTNAVQNLGLAVGPLVVGVIVAETTDFHYRMMMLFFTAIAGLALLNNIALKIYDAQKLNNKLSWSQKETNLHHDKDINVSENLSMPPM